MRYPILIVCALAAMAGRPGLALEVQLQVAESRQVARSPAAVTSGVPLARGAVADVSKLSLSRDGRPIPAQFTATVPWEDGSVRWVLIDTQVDVPAGGKADLVLSTAGANPAPAAPVRVEQNDDSVTVSTGGLKLVLARNQPGLFRSLTIDGKEMLTGQGKGAVVVTDDGKEVIGAAPSQVTVEHAGPMRAVVCVRGQFPGLHDGLLRYTARVTVLAGQKRVNVHFWLENHGADGHDDVDPEWFAFDGMAVDLGLGLGDGELTARCEGVQGKGALTVLQVCEQGKTSPYYTFDNFAYTISSGQEELKRGARTDGVIEIAGPAGTLTAGVGHFWQNYEKAIELDGKRLRLWLWPTDGQWPRPGPGRDSGQLKRLKGLARDGLYLLRGSMHKGHEFVLDFSGRGADVTSAELSWPLFARADSEHYAAAEALPAMFAPAGVKPAGREAKFKLAFWANMGRIAVDPDDSASLWAARREYQRFQIGYHHDTSQWYGWMDFGDLSVPGKGQVSLHYDWPLLVLMEYLRNGNPNALALAGQMARHRIDIDQYWSDRDPEAVNGVQSGAVWPAWHADGRRGGPSPGGTWLAGPALWYMLTGEPKARESCLRSAAGLKAAWAAIAEKKVYGGGLKTDMDANGWAIESFCAAYDLTGDRRWLDEAMKLFDTNITAVWKSAGPHLHSARSQIVGQSYVQDDRRYCHVIAPLCNLHRRTGNEKVLELLVAGCEKEFPESYFGAPMFLAGLFAYTGLAADRADYLKKAENLFVQGFPESRMPPVFLPGNTTWSSQSAMALRAGHAFAYPVWARQQKDK